MPPAKVLKTERTHEENQERAYIAASRRSDRSLEARVESARRASEIHKRRTGRSLRVTEQDVVNEEMYEEEDDDLPMQYRRLTAHLQTGSADFNRRLSAYLTNHVAMRTALDQAITNSYAQHYPNAPQFAHNQSMYPSPFMPQNLPQQPASQSYGQPYPSPGTPSYRPSQQARSASVSQNHGTPTFPASMPTPSPSQAPTPLPNRRTSGSSNASSHSPTAMASSPTSMPQRPSSHHRTSSHSSPQPQQQSFQNMNGYPNIGPFTTALPVESQMFLGGALDPNDPMTSMLMVGSENMPNPFNYSAPSFSKPRNPTRSFDGMSATLAPSALDMSPHDSNHGHPPSTLSMPSPATAMHLGLDGTVPDFSKDPMFASGGSSAGSGTATPAGLDGAWSAFIHDGSWGENVT